MNDLFNSLRAFVTAAEKKAADAANKGADWLEDAATWLRSLAGGGVFSESPEVAADCDALEVRVAELLVVSAEQPDPKKFDPASILIYLQLAKVVLDFIKKWREDRNK